MKTYHNDPSKLTSQVSFLYLTKYGYGMCMLDFLVMRILSGITKGNDYLFLFNGGSSIHYKHSPHTHPYTRYEAARLLVLKHSIRWVVVGARKMFFSLKSMCLQIVRWHSWHENKVNSNIARWQWILCLSVIPIVRPFVWDFVLFFDSSPFPVSGKH